VDMYHAGLVFLSLLLGAHEVRISSGLTPL
jgi:hypothetical protein